MNIRFFLSAVFLTIPAFCYADGANPREARALEACLFDHTDYPTACFDVPYYSCMGEQLNIAAHSNLARERCLYQEIFVWGDVLDMACNDLLALTNEGDVQFEFNRLGCFSNPTKVGDDAFVASGDISSYARQDIWPLDLTAQVVRADAVTMLGLLTAFKSRSAEIGASE